MTHISTSPAKRTMSQTSLFETRPSGPDEDVQRSCSGCKNKIGTTYRDRQKTTCTENLTFCNKIRPKPCHMYQRRPARTAQPLGRSGTSARFHTSAAVQGSQAEAQLGHQPRPRDESVDPFYQEFRSRQVVGDEDVSNRVARCAWCFSA